VRLSKRPQIERAALDADARSESEEASASFSQKMVNHEFKGLDKPILPQRALPNNGSQRMAATVRWMDFEGSSSLAMCI